MSKKYIGYTIEIKNLAKKIRGVRQTPRYGQQYSVHPNKSYDCFVLGELKGTHTRVQGRFTRVA
tara:strand:+ start:377 stop:568 length:192 start_codon:yes stop_codon:yes gene_type:complete